MTKISCFLPIGSEVTSPRKFLRGCEQDTRCDSCDSKETHPPKGVKCAFVLEILRALLCLSAVFGAERFPVIFQQKGIGMALPPLRNYQFSYLIEVIYIV